MVHAEAVEADPLPDDTPPQICATCKNWAPLGNDPVLGQCRVSMRALQAYIVTTDYSACSRWEQHR